MTNFYVSSVDYAAVAQWAASHAYSLGNYVRQLAAPGAGSERVFKCTTAGTSGGSEPAWSVGPNNFTTDSTVQWKSITGQEAEQQAGNWKAPWKTLNAFISVSSISDGDVAFVASTHSESYATATNLGVSGGTIKIISVNSGGVAIPPPDTDYAFGATYQTTGNNDLGFNGGMGYIRGFNLISGLGATGTASINFSSSQKRIFENCAFRLGTTGNSSRIGIADMIFSPSVDWINCTVQFGSVNQALQALYGTLQWRNTAAQNALVGAIVPTTFVKNPLASDQWGHLVMEGLDLSSFNGIIFDTSGIHGVRQARNCKLHASATLFGSLATSGVGIHDDESWWGFDNCDDATNNRKNRFFRIYTNGWTQSEYTFVATGGATDENTPVSWKMTGLNSNSILQSARSPQISKRYETTGASKTIAMEALWLGSGALTNKDLWVEVDALDSSASPLATLYTSGVATPLTAGTTLTGSSQAWDSRATARANSQVCTLGQIKKVSSNSGRVFSCSTAGTCASSLPAGYASAVDGDLITDGTAVFRAAYRYTLSLSFTPGRKGIIAAIIRWSKTGGVDVYVDPKLSIT